MLVCISWMKDGKRKFGRAMSLDCRTMELCQSMRKMTGVAHYPCHISERIAPLVDWSVPEHLDPRWLQFCKYRSVVGRAANKIKNILKKQNLDYHDLKATIEFELFKLMGVVDETKSEPELLLYFETTVVNNCLPIFKERSVDIYNKSFECRLENNHVYPITPEDEVIREQEENLKARAFYHGKKRMTKIERKVFSKLERGLKEKTIANQLHLSIQRVNKLKHRACSIVQKMCGELA